MLLQIDHPILHLFQNLYTLLVIEAPDDPQCQTGAWVKAHGIASLRTMNLVELIVVSLKDSFGFQKSILEQHISAWNVGDANVWEYTDELLVSHEVIYI